jgi:hypothetical protein
LFGRAADLLNYDIFGTLPDVIEDDWIDDIEKLDDRLKDFTK